MMMMYSKNIEGVVLSLLNRGRVNMINGDNSRIERCIGKVVRHFKGNLYIVIEIAEHTETGDKYVVYKALYGGCKVYVRPIEMFREECNQEQYDKYGHKYRFMLCTIDSVVE